MNVRYYITSCWRKLWTYSIQTTLTSTAFACFASTHEFFGSVALVEIEVLGIWAFEKAQVGTHVGN